MLFRSVSGGVAPAGGLPPPGQLGHAPWELPGTTLVESDWDVHRSRLAAREPLHELLMRHDSDGQVTYWSVTARPVHDADGRYLGYRGISRDVTLRVESELALRESEQRFRLLAENIQHVFWIGNPARTRFEYVSPAFDPLWKLPREMLYRTPEAWMRSVHAEDRPSVDALMERLDRMEPGAAEYRIVRADGSIQIGRAHV